MRFELATTMLLLAGTRAFAQGVTATAATPLSIGESFTLQSRLLGEIRRINVYLPPVYAESASVKLPVLYMPDGGLAEDFLHVAGLLQVSVGNGTMRPFLLVGIENTQRRRDLTGPTENPQDKKIAPVVGGSSAFRSFIRDELMPLIRSRYRTTGETAIMGESLAGLFILETFFLEPTLFDTYIAFDPSLWWNNEAMLKAAPDKLRAGITGKRSLYIAISGEPSLAGPGQQLENALSKSAPKSLTWRFERLPDESHATIYHPAALQALRRLFKP